jgi:putative transposase
MRSSRFAHLSPKQLVPQLADEGLYLGSESTFYRLQRRYELRTIKRAMSRTDLTRAATVHHATGPNQVWSWDITWLPTTVRGIYLHLYLVMDVWSRRIVGWRIADGDSAQIAAELITQTCREGNLDPRGLVLHSDNGKPMRASTLIAALQWLGVVPSLPAVRQPRRRTALDGSLRRLVQPSASAQRHPLRDARRATQRP